MQQDDICQRYERIADWFAGARHTGPVLLEQEYLDAALRLLPPGAPVLDLGCGSGEPLAGFFLRAGHPVTGVDGSPRMIALCRRRFPDAEWVVGDMRRIALDRSFGAALAWDSLFHLSFDDQAAMFPVFDAHLAPGGPLLFTSGPARGEVTGIMEGDAFRHYSLDPEEYRALLARYDCTVLLHRMEDPACGRHTVWLAQKRQTGKPDGALRMSPL